MTISLLLILGRAAGVSACDHTGYAGSVTGRCGPLQDLCSAKVSNGDGPQIRHSDLCSNTGPCAEFFQCIEDVLSQTSCAADPQLGEGLQKLRQVCSWSSDVVSTCAIDHPPCSSPNTNTPSRSFKWSTCSNQTHVQQPPGFPYSVPPGRSILPSSAKNRLLVLERVSAKDCSVHHVGRSYDGHAWERVMPHLLQQLTCSTSGCTINVPPICEEVGSACAYRVYAVTDALLTPEQSIARLMQQATFGASRKSLEEFFGNNAPNLDRKAKSVEAETIHGVISEWMKEQMALPYTSLREYYRQRVNNRQTVSVSSAGRRTTPCETGSRWHRYAFNARDKYKRLDFKQENEGTLSLSINGVLRTEIPIAQWRGWTSSRQGIAPKPADVFALPLGAPTKAPTSVRQRGLSEGSPFTADQCPAGSCCVVLYKAEAGAQCNPVPVWDLIHWSHPGGDYVQASSLCGKVRFGWVTKSGSHSMANPEDISLTKLTGGGVKVGTYTDPACPTPAPAAAAPTTGPTPAPTPLSNYVLCDIREDIYNATLKQFSAIKMSRSGTCVGNNKDWFYFANPPINFTHIDPESTHILGSDANLLNLDPVRQNAGSLPFEKPTVVLLKSLGASDTCTKGAVTAAHDRVFMHVNGVFYKFDPRLVLVNNTLEAPAQTGTGIIATSVNAKGGCPSVAKNFLNKDSCVRRPSCASPLFSSVPVPLNASTLLLWYQLSGTYVHYITGLRLEDEYAISPCTGSSRWMRLAGDCTGENAATALDDSTKATLAAVLAATAQTDQNPFVRDISDPLQHAAAPEGATCSAMANGVSSVGAKVSVNGTCWQHVHPHEFNVHDFTTWTLDHDGNNNAAKSGKPNPIMLFAEARRPDLKFPAHHTMVRWSSRLTKGNKGLKSTYLGGRLGDTISFSSLPTSVQTPEMAQHFGALANRPTEGVEACGSPEEVANINTLGAQYHMQLHPEEALYRQEELDHPHSHKEPKGGVWTNVALKSKDQLRQRVAWALSQIIVTSVSGLNRHDEVEPWAVYYDVFVRNAFGNFRNVLREISYNVVMSEYLTFRANKAIAFQGTYPDENYARELMQLFSIGLWKVNEDGTPALEGSGSNREQSVTYTNDDVATFARVWTGFDRQPKRGNLHLPGGFSSNNAVDPMMIKPSWRDRFPKTKLDSGYLGDGYTPCTDLPQRYFLSKGARYKLVPGGFSAEGEKFDSSSWMEDSKLGRFVPSAATSDLYKSLCARASSGNCTFPSEVVLDRALPCDGQECIADRLRSVKLVDKQNGRQVWYESVRPTCIRLTFARESKFTKMMKGTSNSKEEEWHQCADTTAAIATVSCCKVGTTTAVEVYKDTNGAPKPCSFAAEWMTYASADSRCKAIGHEVCKNNYLNTFGKRSKWGCGGDGYFTWLNKPCSVQVQVQANGWINLVEPQPAGLSTKNLKSVQDNPIFRLDSPNVFRVRWANNKFPKQADGCKGLGSEGCTPANDGTCLCNITVAEAAAFTDHTRLPTKSEIDAALFIGSTPPDGFDTVGGASYSKCVADSCVKAGEAGVSLFNKGNSSTLKLNIDTIFEVRGTLAGSKTRFLRNKISTVHVAGFSFRNPPHFMPLLGEKFKHVVHLGEDMALNDAAEEVEALIDHLFEHNNTGPFLSHQLIQRLVTANPSPRYIKAVATAFRTGEYAPAGQKFSGTYGDLGAAIAAVLLDREARSTTLDADPIHGKLREPLLKVLHVFRAMEYRAAKGREVMFKEIIDVIGMAPFESPSVFNFYLPDYQPAGPIALAGLVSPEAQLSTSPLQVAYLNSMASLIDYGLTSCKSGFGDSIARPNRNCAQNSLNNGLSRETSDGVLEFVPTDSSNPAEIVAELSLLLTAGRLSNNSKKVLTTAYRDELEATRPGYCSDSTCNTKKGSNWCNANAKQCVTCQVWAGTWCPTGPGDSAAALKVVQKLAIASTEFHTTSRNIDAQAPRAVPKAHTSMGRGFKSVVVLFLGGGVDSFSLLTPHSSCKQTEFGGDPFDEYTTIRGNVALKKDGADPLLQIVAGESPMQQPCTAMGMHPKLKFLKKAYDEGDAAWVANVGSLVEPTTPQQYKDKSTTLPPSIGAHNVQVRCAQNVHAQQPSAKGVLGRAMNAITADGNKQEPYSSELFSLAGNVKLLEGSSPPVMIDGKVGIVQYVDFAALSPKLANLTQPVSASLHAETYAQSLKSSLSSSDKLGKMLESVAIENDKAFDAAEVADQDREENARLALQLKRVAQIMKLREELDVERAAFVVQLGGFDTHTDEGGVVSRKMETLDAALEVFADELKAQGLWTNTTILTISDFGRTLTSNGAGTDHAWGGNHFILGGDVKGKRIFGQFPSSLNMDTDLIINKRGSVLPTTSWEGMWEGVLQWFGVEDKHMPSVLPNLANFASEWRLDAQKLFRSASS